MNEAMDKLIEIVKKCFATYKFMDNIAIDNKEILASDIAISTIIAGYSLPDPDRLTVDNLVVKALKKFKIADAPLGMIIEIPHKGKRIKLEGKEPSVLFSMSKETWDKLLQHDRETLEKK